MNIKPLKLNKKETYHLRVTLGTDVNIFYLLISCKNYIAWLNLCSKLIQKNKNKTPSTVMRQEIQLVQLVRVCD